MKVIKTGGNIISNHFYCIITKEKMPLIIRRGDTSSHGGSVTTSASRSYAEGALIARIGDTLSCPIHGSNSIVQGSPDSYAEGSQIARHGDQAACGAALISGAVRTYVN